MDDYKLFGEKHAKELINANNILNTIAVSNDVRTNVLNIIRTMGYRKYQHGIRPKTLEGMIVSDADMCDAIGSDGILRASSYGESLQIPFFDKEVLPCVDHGYRQNKHTVQHFFDKLLLIPTIMLTKPGALEAKNRQRIQIEFLRELFREHQATVWAQYLEDFIITHQLIGE